MDYILFKGNLDKGIQTHIYTIHNLASGFKI